MSYLHISNLYKDQTILLFKEAYAMEKIHGTSAHVGWKYETQTIHYFSGGENLQNFMALFDSPALADRFHELFPDIDVVVFGEAYGGKQQGMSHTYGKNLMFVAFDVKVGENWLNVPNAEDVCHKLDIEFVHYDKIVVNLENLEAYRDAGSVQAERNLMGTGHKREGIVLRPLVEMRMNNGERVISKFKPDEFNETRSKREISEDQLKVLNDAKEIAEEWVVLVRLDHVLQKFPADVNMESTGEIIKAMIEDVYREASGEIVESKEVAKAIGAKTVQIFKQKLQNKLK